MLRRTLTILSLIGLLLSVGLWALSLSGFEFTTRELTFVFMLHSGQAFVRIGDPIPDTIKVRGLTLSHGASAPRPPIEIDEVRKLSLKAYRAKPADRRFGFRIRTETDYEFNLSLVKPALLFAFSSCVLALLPLCRRRRKRKKLGLCVKCGYDLRASKERCPECGARFEAPKMKTDCWT